LHKGSRQIGQLERTLPDAIARRKPDLTGLDPFVRCTRLKKTITARWTSCAMC
jgi:hypothetical protein